MCLPACQKKIAQTVDMSRRNFLKSLGAAGAVMAVAPVARGSAPHPRNVSAIRYRRIVDLTHTLFELFPTYFGGQQLEVEALFEAETDGFNLNQWTINEHTGTHMDAPFHFSDQDTADQIPVENLIGSLAVVDIRAKAAANPDAQLTVDDLMAYEQAHGRIPRGAIVAMNSGWDQYVNTPMFRNADTNGVLHFPGFHLEAVQYLLEHRDVKGIMVDTLSLDYGPSADFAVHFEWLPTNRWGMEAVANLGQLPAKGATVVVGSPKIEGATGGPSRIIAFAP